jgi:hypothetical protein
MEFSGLEPRESGLVGRLTAPALLGSIGIRKDLFKMTKSG